MGNNLFDRKRCIFFREIIFEEIISKLNKILKLRKISF